MFDHDHPCVFMDTRPCLDPGEFTQSNRVCVETCTRLDKIIRDERWEDVYASIEYGWGGEEDDVAIVRFRIDIHIDGYHVWVNQMMLSEEMDRLIGAEDAGRFLWNEMVKMMDRQLEEEGYPSHR